LKVKEVVKTLSKETGIGLGTIQSTIAQYKRSKTVHSPNKTKIRVSTKDKIDDFDRDAIRRKVHNFWFQREIPTLDKILKAINEDSDLPTFKRTTLYSIIRDLNFEFVTRP